MNRARIVCVLLSAVACMMVVPPSQALAGGSKGGHSTSTEDLIQIREDGVRKIRKEAAHTIKDLRHTGDKAVEKILKHEGKKNDDKKDAKEAAKATEKLNKECAHGVKEITKERDKTIEKLTDRGAPQRFKGRVWRVAQRRMNAVIRITNEQIARVNAAAA